MKILITGGKSAEAVKLLKAFEPEQVIVADYGDVPAFFSRSYKFVSLGERNDETLAHTLLSSCLDYQADAIIPIHLFEIEPIIKANTLFNEFNIDVLLPRLEELRAYQLGTQANKSNWGIFAKGEVFYITKEIELVLLAASRQNLNGAYYFDMDEDNIQFSLIAI